MSIAIFVIGLLVFMITVYGAVMAGGLLLTSRQLDEQPDLAPDVPDAEDAPAVERAKKIIGTEY